MLWNRKQLGHARHAGPRVFQQGRGGLSRPAARFATCNWSWPRGEDDRLVHTGVYVGDDLDTYLQAARQSHAENITVLDEPIQKIVCLMQGDEFHSTWVANKAVYRTRMGPWPTAASCSSSPRV